MEGELKQHTVVVVGSGGREHAIVWKLSQSPKVAHIYVLPGNGGTEALGRELAKKGAPAVVQNVAGISTNEAIVAFAQEKKASLVVVGPEAPLAAGLGDDLNKAGVPCFGPSKAGAQIEASKVFAKDFMHKHNIPTATYQVFDDAEKALKYIDDTPHTLVVKASGLAAGKGVIVPKNKDEAKQAVREIMVDKVFGEAGNQVVLEELLVGPEVSFLGFCDGTTVVPMPAAQDHKRALDNDKGANTGGMGAFAPTPAVTPEMAQEWTATVLQAALDGLKKDGIPFVGVLFAGLMLTKNGPRVLEYNCRFGDPETQVILPLLKTDLFEVMLACVQGRLAQLRVEWATARAAVTVVAASGGYPDKYPVDKPIAGLNSLPQSIDAEGGVYVFHAGTKAAADGQGVVTSGGRVLAVTAVSPRPAQAIARAYAALDKIHFDGMHYRCDIGSYFANNTPVRLAVLGSTRGTDMQAIIDAIARRELNAEIALVVSNRADAYILERARAHGIAHHFVEPRDADGKLKPREAYDREVIAALDGVDGGVDLVLMIGYMRIVSAAFVERFRGRLYNVHPSLLPDFAGGMDLDVHQAVLDSGAKFTGCTVHVVTEEVDAGPILVQKRCAIDATDNADTLKAKVQHLEGVALIEAIQLFEQQEKQKYRAEEVKRQQRREKRKAAEGQGPVTYRSAGVDIDAGNLLVERIKPFTKATARPGTSANIGGFGGLFDLKEAGYRDPLLVSGTDGVGTKLKIAQEVKKHDTLGQDLVAMCVNDILTRGAEPLFFLDYFATGALAVDEATQVVKGIADGCMLAGCALVGGETAEMPGMYPPGEYDLAGFAVGAVERDGVLPIMDTIKEGDVVIGLASSGLHSNGFSLVRHIIKLNNIDVSAKPPFASKHEKLAHALLEPTRIYVKSVLPLMKARKIKAAAHITGGGLLENIPRVLTPKIGVDLDVAQWSVPPVFGWLASLGQLQPREMLRTLNVGIGMTLLVAPDHVASVLEALTASGEDARVIGKVVPRRLDDSEQVHVANAQLLASPAPATF